MHYSIWCIDSADIFGIVHCWICTFYCAIRWYNILATICFVMVLTIFKNFHCYASTHCIQRLRVKNHSVCARHCAYVDECVWATKLALVNNKRNILEPFKAIGLKKETNNLFRFSSKNLIKCLNVWGEEKGIFFKMRVIVKSTDWGQCDEIETTLKIIKMYR